MTRSMLAPNSSDDDHLNDILNEHTESISSCNIIKESDKRERK